MLAFANYLVMNSFKHHFLTEVLSRISLKFSIKKYNESSERFLCIPSSSNDFRWLISLNINNPSKVLSQWTPYSFLASIIWRVICACLRSRFGRGLPVFPKIYIANFDSFLQTITHDCAEDYSAMIYIGTQGKFQKSVLVLCDKNTSSPLYVVKIPLTPLAYKSVSNENRVLQYIRNHKFPSQLSPNIHTHVPIWHSTMQSWLAGNPAPIQLTKAHYLFLSSLVNEQLVLDIEPIKLHFLQRVQRLLSLGLSLPGKITNDVSYLRNLSFEFSLPSVLVHGDFAPWNLKINGKGQISALDWEFSSVDYLPGYDYCYYSIQVSRLLNIEVIFDSFTLRKHFHNLFRCISDASLDHYCLLVRNIIELDLYERINL